GHGADDGKYGGVHREGYGGNLEVKGGADELAVALSGVNRQSRRRQSGGCRGSIGTASAIVFVQRRGTERGSSFCVEYFRRAGGKGICPWFRRGRAPDSF